MLPVTIAKAKEIVIKCFKANLETKKRGTGLYLVPFMHSQPSTAKSATMAAIAKQFNLKFIPITLSLEDPIFIVGGIKVTDSGRTVSAPPTRIPLDTDPLPLQKQYLNLQTKYDEVLGSKDAKQIKEFQKRFCYRGWCVFFDEFSDAAPTLQAMCNRILNERMVGEHNIHPLCMMTGAGNRLKDKGAVKKPMANPTKSRLWHIVVAPDYPTTLNHFIEQQYDARILACLYHHPDEFDSFEKYLETDSSDLTYRCSRTWDMANSFAKANYPDETKPFPPEAAVEFEGALGSFASSLVVLSSCLADIPDTADIIANPETCSIPDSAGTKMMLATSLASKVTKDNQEAIVKYILRMDKIYIQPFVVLAFSKGLAVSSIDALKPYMTHIVKLNQLAK